MYRKSLNSQMIKIENKFIITDLHTFYEVNETGARIYDLCNGKNSNEDIASLLANKFNENIKNTLSDVVEYTEGLYKANLLIKAN
ncbi:MAG: PqqD family protein [Vagococcus fluvialis]